MKKYFLGWMIFVLCSTSSFAGYRLGGYRGIYELEKDIETKLFSPHSIFSLTDYLLEDQRLAQLLGSYKEEKGINVFRNDIPTALNFTLYYAMIFNLAQDLASTCTTGNNFLKVSQDRTVSFHPKFWDRQKELCTFFKSSALGETALRNYWEALMGYGASGEYDAWRALARGLRQRQTPVAEAVRDSIAGILLNPHFLLEK